MLGPRTVRRRTFLAILVVALIPAAAALLAGTYLLTGVGASTGTLGPWDAVATSGEALVEAAARAAPGDSALLRAAEAHEVALSASVRRSRLWSYVAERSLRVLPLVAAGSVLLLAVAASAAAGRLSRSFSRPVQQLVGWTGRIARGEALPDVSTDPSDEVVEFAQLRQALRDMAAQLADGRRRELEAARLRAWTDMARRVAHDIKNPLTPMQLAARTLAGSDEPRVASAASLLLEEIARLDDMARSLAQLGRLPESPPAPVDLDELLRKLAARHGTGSVPIHVVARDAPALVLGHHDLLERVFRNILVNAVEASEPRGGGAVDVRLAQQNGHVQVTIRDHGPGLPEQLLDSIWLPDVTTKRHGTGLGLAIVRQGVEAHTGEVRARNADGGGAEFEVLLPVRGHDGA
jgi:nitrogen fixation/metabolism regulation signal transduction histidine kinase